MNSINCTVCISGAYFGPNCVYALKGFHGAVLCIKYPSGEQDIRTLDLTFFSKLKLLKYCNMSQCRERSERRKNQYFGINEHYLFLFNAYLYVSSLHVQT